MLGQKSPKNTPGVRNQPSENLNVRWVVSVIVGVMLTCSVLSFAVVQVGRSFAQRMADPIMDRVMSERLGTLPNVDAPIVQPESPSSAPNTTAPNTTAPDTTAPQQQTPSASAITSKDGTFRIAQPGTMTTSSDLINEGVQLGISDEMRGQYLIAVSIDPKLLNLDKNAFEEFQEGLAIGTAKGLDATISGGGRVSINDLPGFIYEMGSSMEGVDMNYWVVVLDGGGVYYQIIAWTPSEYRDDNIDALTEALESFEQIR